MSTAIDGRRRPNLWSYISFSSSPRRRSVSLPTKSPHDPYEKADRHFTYPEERRSNFLAGVSDAWMNQSSRSRYLRVGGLIAVVVFLFFLLSPSERTRVKDFVGSHGGSAQSGSGRGGCTKPYSSDKPLIQYALMIDAGSTGSRIHVYRFNNCGPTPELEHEEFAMTEKKPGGAGLSSYDTDAEGAARSLDPLMKVAVDFVPDEYKSCSPIAVKATAGLRLLGDEKSLHILDAVRARLETKYPFPVVSREKKGVDIMDGSDEGVYAWITTNFLLGKIGNPDNTPTAAVLDLGGGSTQIVFHPTFKHSAHGPPEKLAEGTHKYALDFGGRSFDLYQHSHLGYGLMAARDSIHKLVVGAQLAAHPAAVERWPDVPIEHPCIPPDMTTSPATLVRLDSGAEHNVTFTGTAAPSPAQCRGLAERILMKDYECELTPCSFKGVHQPSLDRTFAREDLYIISYFYDRLQPLGMPESFTLREMRDITAQVCQGRSGWGGFESVEGAIAELEDRPEHCLDLNFMMALLHTGYEMPIDREVRIAKKIRGKELGWCLGASLPLLSQDSGWTCKIKQVA